MPIPDRELFNGFLEKYFVRVYNYLLRLLRSPEKAEDLTQEAFLRAWESFRRYDRSRPFLPWILRIARNRALDHMRRNREQPQAEFPTLTGPASPERDLLKQEENAALESALLALPEKQRTAVYLYYIEEMPLPGVARVVGRSPAAVAALLHRARAAMRECMTART